VIRANAIRGPQGGGPPVARAGWRRAALLLEVVIALTILVAALGVLGGQLAGGLDMTAYAEQQTRAAQLTDRVMGLLELDPEILERFVDEDVVDGDFGDSHPGWFWRVSLEPTDVENLARVKLEVLYQSDPDRQERIDDARPVRTVHLLKTPPPQIDLARDFGVDEEQLQQITESLPIPGLENGNLDPLALAQAITPETLPELLPALLPLIQQFLGAGLPPDATPEDLTSLLGDGLSGLSGGAPAGASGGEQGGGVPGGLREIIRSAIGDQVSDEELDAALSGVGAGGGGQGQGRTIEDLDRLRDQFNERTGRRP
jgi:hypothetical protein